MEIRVLKNNSSSCGLRIDWLKLRAAALALLVSFVGGASVAASLGQDARLSTFCAEGSSASTTPEAHQWRTSAVSTVLVGIKEPCWVRIETKSGDSPLDTKQTLVVSESLALNIQAFDAHGKLLARSAPGLQPQGAIYAGRMVLLEHLAESEEPVLLHLTLDPLSSEFTEIEVQLQWAATDAVLAPLMFELSQSLLGAGALAFVIVLSCALAFALRRPLFVLGGCASLINVQYLIGTSGSYRVLKLPMELFVYQSPLLLVCFGMLLIFVVEFCNFRQHSRWAAFALLALSSLFFLAGLILLGKPDAFVAFDLYEWLRLPAYLVMLYGLIRCVRLKQTAGAICLAALVPDYVYLFFYTVPHLHWILGDTVAVQLPEFMEGGSLVELFVILWLPFMLCMALTHRVLTVERERTNAALTDALTGLPNREGLWVATRRLGGPLTIVALDLNRFKSIDMALGALLSDQVLQGFALRLLRLSHATIARLHSDRFALVLPGHVETASLRSQIESLLEEPLQVQGQVVDLSVTLGVYTYDSSEKSEQGLRLAEVALYQAHQRHVAALAYEVSFEQLRHGDLSLMSDLHKAVNNQELRLFLQPKVRLSDGLVNAAEGLVRWIHPQRGMVPPNEFISFAEQIGRIGVITQWVLAQAMEFAAAQRRAGTPLQISVNISAVDLVDEDFVNKVVKLSKESGVEPRDIKLEITESAAMEEPGHALAAMQALNDIGFEWALDDFGTGYSSLSYLQKMPLAELKIDRAFVRDVTPDSEAARLLGSIIALGHQLGLTVVAEGAETRSEWNLLSQLGADMVQGWFAAKAMPLQEFIQWRLDHPRFVG